MSSASPSASASCDAPHAIPFDSTIINENSTIKLNDGYAMPIMGLGGGIFSTEAEAAFTSAIQLGYRLIDTAPKYGESEAALGHAVAKSDVPREALFLVSKVGNVGYAAALDSFKASIARLRTSYLDLLLMHSAIYQGAKDQPRSPLHASSRADTWRAFVELRRQGRVRSIGVCNHSPRQIAKLSPAPAVVQVEFHPLLQRTETALYCRDNGIALVAYGSGGGGWRLWQKDASLDLLGSAPLQQAASARGRSAHQVSLRWALEHGACVIPKAATPAHQAENRRLFDFALTPEEHASLAALDAQRSLYRFRDPDEFA